MVRHIRGNVTIHGAIGGTITTTSGVVGTISRTAAKDITLPWYEGPYDAIPTVSGLTLATAKRSMKDDVSVEPIPIGSVSNEAGGRTVSIG